MEALGEIATTTLDNMRHFAEGTACPNLVVEA